jgi:DNA-binding response OmpR family regulator
MRVLVVEDQNDLREVVAETLREESCAVDESADGE